ncbi:MAG: ImmA/IrrE family metallo-endopeptidase [Deltaproteobacteria bacterium]|nr:ImmA/IrrE family metallo-endopeptidase [Deltaproteobacteria bacterium]
MPFRYGFKAESERRAAEWRARFKLRSEEPLDPRRIAQHMGIEVVKISDLVGLKKTSLAHLMGAGAKDFSAAAVGLGSQWLIVENEAHSIGRRTNSVAHELSHLLLKHPPHPQFGNGGMRNHWKQIEDEADWLGGTLLVPRPAALAVAVEGLDIDTAATRYGVSVPLMRQRLNATGAMIQVKRSRGVN